MTKTREKNHYELLGLTRDASTDEIKERYKEIARVYHPDSNFFDEIIEDSLSREQEALFSAITNAYNTLITPTKRREYDESLPPELQDWDEESPRERAREKHRPQDQSKSPTPAFGTFGRVKEEAKQDDAVDIQPVSSYLRMRRRPLPVRLWLQFSDALGKLLKRH